MTNKTSDVETKLPEMSIPSRLYHRLEYLGIINSDSVRSGNFGESDYSKHLIQPWSIWLDHDLDPFDADIIKRVLRRKGDTEGEVFSNRITDYQKIIHICKERLRVLQSMGTPIKEVKHEEQEQ